MSAGAARLFAFLQDADFYRELHEQAASLIEASGAWLDVGCGPGLLTRIAAERGFAALGVDRDPSQIALARRLARERRSAGDFAVGDGLAASPRRFDVVSASSLLAVAPNPRVALENLMLKLLPSGVLLVIEPNKRMTRRTAFRLWRDGRLGRRGFMAIAWARAREGRTLDPATFAHPDWSAEAHDLLHGLVEATLLRRRCDRQQATPLPAL